MSICRWIFSLVVFFTLLGSSGHAQDFDAAIKMLLPDGLETGMPVPILKSRRPKIFDGPEAFDPQGESHKIYMETQGLGKPG